ncbi:MAG: M23 family metallopeptidase [Bdellovibrionota bacterium]
MPVLGTIVEQSANGAGVKYIVNSDSSKAHAPMDGFVYYVGRLDDYGLAVIIKNSRKVSIIGNLDRSTVVKNQYVFQGDALGSVVYKSRVIYAVQQVRKIDQDNNLRRIQQKSSSINFAQKFEEKFLQFAKNGGDFLKLVSTKTSRKIGENQILTYHDVSDLLKNIGFPEKYIPTMYCIAKWESGLNPKALNFNNNNTVDVGLFQINSIWFDKCGTNLATLYDEKENSRCALTVLQNQGFPAWTTYNKYKRNSATIDYCEM